MNQQSSRSPSAAVLPGVLQPILRSLLAQAAAGNPTRSQRYDAPAGEACESPLLVVGTGSKVQVHEFRGPKGQIGARN